VIDPYQAFICSADIKAGEPNNHVAIPVAVYVTGRGHRVAQEGIILATIPLPVGGGRQADDEPR